MPHRPSHPRSDRPSASLGFRILAAAVFVVAIAMVAAGGTMAAWSWATPGVHVAFRIALPVLALWLLVEMIRLAIALPRVLDGNAAAAGAFAPDPLTALAAQPRHAPDAALRQAAPDAAFVQRLALPAEPGARWGQRRRRRVAERIGLADGRHRYRVGPARPRYAARRLAAARPAARRVVAAVALVAATMALLVLLGPLDGNELFQQLADLF